jgi:hypothetical protein
LMPDAQPDPARIPMLTIAENRSSNGQRGPRRGSVEGCQCNQDRRVRP